MEKKVSYNRSVIENLSSQSVKELKARFLKPEEDTSRVTMVREFNDILNTETEDGFYKFSSLASLSQPNLEYVYEETKQLNSNLSRSTGRKLNLLNVIDDIDLLFFQNLEAIDSSVERDSKGVDTIVKDMLKDFFDNVLKRVSTKTHDADGSLTVS